MVIHRKLRKFLNRSRLVPGVCVGGGERSITPIIITDSKQTRNPHTETEQQNKGSFGFAVKGLDLESVGGGLSNLSKH